MGALGFRYWDRFLRLGHRAFGGATVEALQGSREDVIFLHVVCLIS